MAPFGVIKKKKPEILWAVAIHTWYQNTAAQDQPLYSANPLYHDTTLTFVNFHYPI